MNKIKEMLENLDQEDRLVLKGFSYCLAAILLLIIGMSL